MNTQHGQQLTVMMARYQRSAVRIAFGLVLVALIAASLRATGGFPATEAGSTTVVVQQGDTLWDIAVRHGPASADPRATVARIRQANGIAGSLIYPGDVLRVPQR